MQTWVPEHAMELGSEDLEVRDLGLLPICPQNTGQNPSLGGLEPPTVQ